MHRVDHRARSEEQERLEERVRHEVKHAGDVGARADADEHVAELRDRGVRQDLLDVPLLEADRRREDRGQRADHDDDDLRDRRHREQHVASRDQVDAGRDHRRRVDERRDRRRAGHGVGQPDVERDLRALAGASEEQKQADRGDDRTAERQRARCRRGRR